MTRECKGRMWAWAWGGGMNSTFKTLQKGSCDSRVEQEKKERPRRQAKAKL